MTIILIIDDQPHIQELFSKELEEEGYRIIRAGDAGKARIYLRNLRPDLVLLDLYLNGLEGWDLLEEIKRKYPFLPVLIVTAYDSYVNDPRVSLADGYVVKSFSNFDKLKTVITDVLKGTIDSGTQNISRNNL